MARDIFEGDRKYNPRFAWQDSLRSTGPVGNVFGNTLPGPGSPSTSGGGGGGGLPFPVTWGPGGATGASIGAGAAGGGMSSATGMILASLIQSGLGFAGGLLSDDTERVGFGGDVGAEKLLGDAMGGVRKLYDGWAPQISKPVTLRNAGVQSIEPVNVPGLPFQIGGGFGVDPAMADPSLLSYAQPDFAGMDLFGGSQKPKPDGTTQPSSGTRRRQPGGSK